MILRPAASNVEALTSGLLALVTYLPDPLGAFLTGLRRFLPGETYPEAHITFLPPRSLSMSMEAASNEVASILEFIEPFELELGSVQMFPQTNIVYIDIQSGQQQLQKLHNLLNCGNLFADEHFEFIPHLTLGGPLGIDQKDCHLEKARQAWANSGLSPRFTVSEVVLLWQSAEVDGEWVRISAHPLRLAAQRSLATQT